MISVRTTGLVVSMALRAKQTKTTIVSEWRPEMVSEGSENCLRRSLTIYVIHASISSVWNMHSQISRSVDDTFPFPAKEKASPWLSIALLLSFRTLSFSVTRTLIEQALCIFFVSVSVIYNLVVSLSSLVSFISSECGDASGSVNGLLPPAGVSGWSLRYTNDFWVTSPRAFPFATSSWAGSHHHSDISCLSQAPKNLAQAAK